MGRWGLGFGACEPIIEGIVKKEHKGIVQY